MNILIFGASGKTGHELVKQALAKGHIVTAFIRDLSKMKIAHENLKCIQGDVIDYPLVAHCMIGQDAVLSALGAPSPFTYDQVIVDGAGNIIKAMEMNHVNRLIYMSFVGIKESRPAAGFVIKYIAPILLSSEIAGHEAREKLIKHSLLQWTIVRAATLTNGKHLGQFRHGENITSKGFMDTISRKDVADFMLQQLTDHTYMKKATSLMY